MAASSILQSSRPRQTSPLLYFLIFALALFIGILVFAYMVTKRTHPIYVDEQGRPVNAETAGHNDGGHK